MPDEVPTPDREQRAISSRALAWIGLSIAAVLCLVGIVSYRMLIHYERRAALHIPADVGFAARIDLEQVVLFEPVRKHLLPLINELPLGPAGAEAGKGPDRLTRLRERVGLNLALDLREVMFAEEGRSGQWVLVLGGLFDQRGVVPAIASVLHEEGALDAAQTEGELRFERWGVTLGQADDGCLVLASSSSMLRRALQVTERFAELGLPREGAAAAALTAEHARSWLGGDSAFAFDEPAVRRIVGTLGLGDALQLELRIQVQRAAELPPIRAGILRWRETYVSALPFIPQADWGGERALLARARVSEPSETLMIVSSSWERAELDRAAQSLAAWLERRFLSPSPGAPGK